MTFATKFETPKQSKSPDSFESEISAKKAKLIKLLVQLIYNKADNTSNQNLNTSITLAIYDLKMLGCSVGAEGNILNIYDISTIQELISALED
jgi:hypothetical protein